MEKRTYNKLVRDKIIKKKERIPGAELRGIEDFSLKSLRMWGNKSPIPPGFRSKLRGIKPKEILIKANRAFLPFPSGTNTVRDWGSTFAGIISAAPPSSPRQTPVGQSPASCDTPDQRSSVVKM
jgi:hypothetical protein